MNDSVTRKGLICHAVCVRLYQKVPSSSLNPEDILKTRLPSSQGQCETQKVSRPPRFGRTLQLVDRSLAGTHSFISFFFYPFALLITPLKLHSEACYAVFIIGSLLTSNVKVRRAKTRVSAWMTCRCDSTNIYHALIQQPVLN